MLQQQGTRTEHVGLLLNLQKAPGQAAPAPMTSRCSAAERYRRVCHRCRQCVCGLAQHTRSFSCRSKALRTASVLGILRSACLCTIVIVRAVPPKGSKAAAMIPQDSQHCQMLPQEMNQATPSTSCLPLLHMKPTSSAICTLPGRTCPLPGHMCMVSAPRAAAAASAWISARTSSSRPVAGVQQDMTC